MSPADTINPRTVRQELDTAIEGTQAQSVIAGLSSAMEQKVMGALASMTGAERNEMTQRLMRMTAQNADSVLAEVVGSARSQSAQGQVTYTVKSGDSLSKIAKSHNISLQAILKANPDIKNPDLIHPNQVVQIPHN
jgi:LysM repeat protein